MERGGQGRTLIYGGVVIVVGVLATTLAQTDVLGRLPLQNLLKNELHVGRAANAAFFFWAGLPWYFKPFAGIVTDAFPLIGSRRRNYLVVSATLGALAWIGLCFTPHDYGRLLWGCIGVNLFMVTASTVVGGYMVETAQAVSGSGRLTAVRNFVEQACTLINGPVSGLLASVAFGWTTIACGGVMFLLAPAAILFLREGRQRVDSGQRLAAAGRQLQTIGAARTLWAAAGLSALFYIAPGLSTALFYKQQTDLHMTTQGQGALALISGACGIVAALAYGLTCRRLTLRVLLIICLSAATAANLGYLFYDSVGAAQVIEGVNGFGFTLAELALMNLAVRATPTGSEGLGFSIMVSVRNFALFGTDWLGSKLLETYHLPFNTLVLANAATTLVTVPLVLWLPAALVSRRDAEPALEVAEPRTALQA